MSSREQAVIRRAGPDDAGAIVRLIEELAEFEQLRSEVKVTEADILRDGFGSSPSFECLIAEDPAVGEALGFALFFQSYSTFEGRPCLYLEDVFVTEAARGRGLGRRLIASLAALALERGLPRLDLSVLHWNEARGFYERLGFVPLGDWRPYRLTGAALSALGRAAGE